MHLFLSYSNMLTLPMAIEALDHFTQQLNERAYAEAVGEN